MIDIQYRNDIISQSSFSYNQIFILSVIQFDYLILEFSFSLPGYSISAVVNYSFVNLKIIQNSIIKIILL